MDAGAKHFLQEFGFSSLIEKFAEQYIDYATLIHLEKEDVEKLIDQLGLQKKFLNSLQDHINFLHDSDKTFEDENHNKEQTSENNCSYQHSQRDLELLRDQNIIIEEPPSNRKKTTILTEENFVSRNLQGKSNGPHQNVINSEPPLKRARNLIYNPVENSVKKYLDANYKGRKFIGLYLNGHFDSTVRSNFAEYLIDCEFNADNDIHKVITPERFMTLREEIFQLFPNESRSTYYVPRVPKSSIEGAKQPKGKLYDKYTKLLKELRAAGLRKSEKEIFEEDSAETPELDGRINGDLMWLKRCLEPFDEASERWKRTCNVRLHSLRVNANRRSGTKKTLDNVSAYFDEFKVLRQPTGYSLLQLDFNHLYGGHELKLIENWSEISLRIKCMSNVEPIVNDTIEDTVETLNLIPKLFLPLNVGKWKTSAVDALSGFLLHVEDTNGIEVAVQRLKNKLNSVKKTLQPFPIIVGPNVNTITDSYVYIDTFYYRVDSPLRAVDVCFKAYHALHAFYPYQSTNSWMFLQKAVYGIVTKWDPEIPSVEMRIKEYLDLDFSVA